MLNKFKKEFLRIIKAFHVKPIKGVVTKKRLKRHKKELDKLLESEVIFNSEGD